MSLTWVLQTRNITKSEVWDRDYETEERYSSRNVLKDLSSCLEMIVKDLSKFYPGVKEKDEEKQVVVGGG